MALTTFQQLRDLTARINRYRHEYHDLKAPSVTDEEYDRVLGDLTALEKTIGTRMADSPTWKIGYPSVKDLIQVVHTIPFPSPRVTARIEDIASFAGEQKVLILLYLDGPTVKLTYEGGELIEMATQGNGSKGEDITHNARSISGIPAKITCQERLVVLGKVFIRPSDFEELKSTLANNGGNAYPSGRNFADDSVRLRESAVCRDRRLTFMPFHVLEGFVSLETKAKRLQELGRYGFCGSDGLASRGALSNEDLDGVLKKLPQYAQKQDLPLDGILFAYNDVVVSKAQGQGQDILIFKAGGDCGRRSPFMDCLAAMNIPALGTAEIHTLTQHFNENLDDFEEAVMAGYDFSQISGFNAALQESICQWFQDEENWCRWMELREQAEHMGPNAA